MNIGHGPYGKPRDAKVLDFIGVPLIKINTSCITTLCGEEQVVCHSKDSTHESHQESWSPTLYNLCSNKNDIDFDRNVGFVTTDTVNLDLPSSPLHWYVRY